MYTTDPLPTHAIDPKKHKFSQCSHSLLLHAPNLRPFSASWVYPAPLSLLVRYCGLVLCELCYRLRHPVSPRVKPFLGILSLVPTCGELDTILIGDSFMQ